MKIDNNYKISIFFTVFPIVIGRFFSISREIMLIAFGIAILSICIPIIGNYIYDKFEKFGKFIGKYIAMIVLFFVWIFAVLPTGVLMKITKRDRLRLKKQICNSYWIDNKNKKTEYEYQF